MILLIAPRYNVSLITMLAQQFANNEQIRVIEDQRIKERRARPMMFERTRRHHERRGSFWAFKGVFTNET